MTAAKLTDSANPPAIGKPCCRTDERFALNTAARWRPVDDETWRIGLVEDASLGGLRLGLAEPSALRCGDRVELGVPLIGDVTARVVRTGATALGLAFEALAGETRDRLVRVLFAKRRTVLRAARRRRKGLSRSGSSLAPPCWGWRHWR